MSIISYGKKKKRRPRDLPLFCREEFYLRRLTRPERIGWEPTLEEILDPNFLLAVYDDLRRNKGPSAGPDCIGIEQIGRREMAEGLRLIHDDILFDEWLPGPTRSKAIRKLNGEMRILHLSNVIDRVIYSGLQRYMAPFWEHFFLDGSHGCRPRRSHLTLLADLEKTIIGRQLFVIALDDIRKAFDSVHLEHVVEVHREFIKGKELLRFIAAAMRGGNPNRVIGIDQGNAYSPLALNALLHKCLDQFFASAAVVWFRFVDNLFFVTRELLEANILLNVAAERLQSIHLELKGEDVPRDIRMDPVETLGFTISANQNRIEYGLGKNAMTKLTQSLERCNISDNPPETACAVIRGWIGAKGPAFEGGLPKETLELIIETARGWGFTEMESPTKLRNRAAESYDNWRRLRRERGLPE